MGGPLIRPAFAEQAKKGGTIRLGLKGGDTSDSLDPRSYSNAVPTIIGNAVMNGLIEIDADRKPQGELLESWEVRSRATEWIFNVRKGITFHNGKSLDAEDIIYSLRLHLGPDSKSAAAGNLKHLKTVEKLDTHQIRIELASPDADLLYTLSDFHIMVVPNGFTDWANPVGTGAFKVENFQPGLSARLVNAGGYWKPGRGNVEAVELTVVNDVAQRMNALIAGQVDVISDVDRKSVDLLKAVPDIELVQAPGGWHTIMAMQMDHAPFNNPDLPKALKYACDREQILKTLFNGYGRVGNDQPIPASDPYFNSDLPAPAYDPDKARFHFKKAGLSDPQITLSVSDAAYAGAVDMATLYQASAAKAGVPLQTRKEPIDGFWSNVWLKAPFCVSYWGGRASATEMLSAAYARGTDWNETHWSDDRFEKLLGDAKAETDEAKRKAYIWEMQAMLSENGGALIPVFSDWLDAHHSRVKGHTPHGLFDLDNQRICEKVWLES
jgi:peptide/nickel transport system substrate-binding protein